MDYVPIQNLWETYIDSITLKGKWKHSIIPETRWGYPVFVTLVSAALCVLVSEVWKGKEIKK